MTRNSYQILHVEPYRSFPYHVGVRRSVNRQADFQPLIEMEQWIVEQVGDLENIYDNNAQWFLSYAIREMVVFGFKDKDVALRFRMHFD